MSRRIWRMAGLVAAVFALSAGIALAQSNARRGPAGSSMQGMLVVNSNVQGASVAINDSLVGTTPYSRNLNPGTYNVTVRATGYNDYNTTVTVVGQTTVNAYLQPINFSFTVNSNVHGAIVFINGQQMGRAPHTLTLAPGSYHLRVTAPGYGDYSTQVTINQNSSITAMLQPQLATIHIAIPTRFLNIHGDRGRGDRHRAEQDIHVFVDNRPVSRDSFQLPQGNHSIRFESGSLEVEQTFYFAAGRSYTVSPMLSISVQ